MMLDRYFLYCVNPVINRQFKLGFDFPESIDANLTAAKRILSKVRQPEATVTDTQGLNRLSLFAEPPISKEPENSSSEKTFTLG